MQYSELWQHVHDVDKAQTPGKCGVVSDSGGRSLGIKFINEIREAGNCSGGETRQASRNKPNDIQPEKKA